MFQAIPKQRRFAFAFAFAALALVLAAFLVSGHPAQAVDNCNLAALKAIVSTGGTLDFNCAADTTITLDGTQTIAKDLTLTNTGAGKVSISGNYQYQIFSVTSGISLSLTNLNLTGGSTTNNGGAIDNKSGGTVTISNSTLSGNSATYYGAAIYNNNGGTVTISNSTLSGNSAAVGGAILSFGGTVTISNSTLSGNSAISSGGAIFNQGKSSTLMISNSTLSGNSANTGGAIYNFGGGTVTISNSTLSGNSANTGGAIGSTSGTVTISNSSLYSNSASYGGAIENSVGSTVTITNSTLYSNSATYDGGTIDNNSGSTVNLQNSLLQGSNICFGNSFIDKGYNLEAEATNSYTCELGASSMNTTDAILGTLRNNGGTTNTVALLSGSPAIGAIPAASCVVTADQRGVNRPQGTKCDIGAFEVVVNPATPTVTTNPTNTTVTAGNAANFTAAASGNPIPTVQWQSSSNGTTWSDVSGATSTTYSVTPTATSDSGKQYRAVFTSLIGSATSSTAIMTVNPGTASKLIFSTQPSGAVAGTAFTTQPIVVVQDAYGNTATSLSSPITLTIKTGTGTLSGTTSATASNGVASFSGLSIDKSGSFVLTASATSLTSGDSSSFTVSPGTASQLVFSTQPSGAVAGTAFTTQPIVTVQDANGNTITNNTDAITIAIKSGTGIAGAALTTTLTVNAVAGVATFSGLKIDLAGTGYVLNASAAGLTSIDSNSFDVSAGKSSAVIPKNIKPGKPFSVQAIIRDANGDVVTSYNDDVTVELKNGNSMANAAPNPSGATLSGTLTVKAVNGVATFYNLSIDKLGTYVLTFTAPGIGFIFDSAPFDVTAEVVSYPADLVPQLRVRPDRIVANNPENQVSFSFKVKNIGKGEASSIVISLPIPQGLDVGYLAEGASKDVWITQVTTSTVKIALPKLEENQEASGTLVFRPNGNAVVETEIVARYSLTFDDPTRSGKALNSNTQRFVYGSENFDESEGAVQRGAVISAKVGETVSITQTGYLADEFVALWYTSPNSTTVSLGMHRATADGVLSVVLDTTGVAAGDYAVVGYGNRSEFTQVNILTVMAS